MSHQGERTWDCDSLRSGNLGRSRRDVAPTPWEALPAPLGTHSADRSCTVARAGRRAACRELMFGSRWFWVQAVDPSLTFFFDF